MYIRRWWYQNGIRLGLMGLALGAAWGIRQTQGAAIFEIYQLLARPFVGAPTITATAPVEPADTPRVRQLEQRLTELESQNQRLQELLGYTEEHPKEGIVAPVVGRSPDHWWQQIILGRGQQDGIAVGAIAAGNGGIVGRVTQVTAHSSRVLLISDPTSQVGVTISRSRYMGYIRGQAANRVIMEFFDKVPDVRPGDVVATSTYSRLFSPGLPVGVIESVNLNKSPAPEAVIELSAPISHLEWVIVYKNPRNTPQDMLSPTEPQQSDEQPDEQASEQPETSDASPAPTGDSTSQQESRNP